MLHPNQSTFIGEKMPSTTIHFGLQGMEVTCKHINTLKENELGLSTNIIETLQLPIGIDYELIFQNEGILIGPFIGILIKDSHAVLNKKGEN